MKIRIHGKEYNNKDEYHKYLVDKWSKNFTLADANTLNSLVILESEPYTPVNPEDGTPDNPFIIED